MGFLLFTGTPKPALAPVEVPVVPSYIVAMTAYEAVPEQTDETPFETASGAYSNPEVVAARSRDMAEELPFGTIIEIDGPASEQNSCGYSMVAKKVGYRVIADTMNARFTNRIDILLDTTTYVMGDGHSESAGSVMGVCHEVTVRVVGHVSINRIPKTQAELAALVAGEEHPLAVK